jgi:hypothetical protein
LRRIACTNVHAYAHKHGCRINLRLHTCMPLYYVYLLAHRSRQASHICVMVPLLLTCLTLACMRLQCEIENLKKQLDDLNKAHAPCPNIITGLQSELEELKAAHAPCNAQVCMSRVSHMHESHTVTRVYLTMTHHNPKQSATTSDPGTLAHVSLTSDQGAQVASGQAGQGST